MAVRDVVTLTGAKRPTAKAHIRQLVNAGILVQRGRGRGTFYVRREP